MVKNLSLIRNDSVFAELPDALVMEILKCSFLSIFGPGRTISYGEKQADEFHYILEGSVKSIYQLLDRRILFALYRKSDWLACRSSTDAANTYTFETLSDTTLLTIHAEDLRSVFARFPGYILHFENKIWSYIAGQELRIRMILGRSAKERYQFFLDHYEEDFGSLFLKDIASFLDLTPETLSRVRNAMLFPE